MSQTSNMVIPDAGPELAPQVADLIVAYLEQIGVDIVFGVPGGAIEPLYNALARSGRRGGPRPMVARHESGAAFMADGYSRETGRIGVCCGTSGPGATNLITGVACAYENSVPMLVITGQPSLPSFGKRALQESACTGINTLGMFRHCTRYNSLVSHPEQLETKLIMALQRAMHTPQGPVHLTIPLDILRAPSPVAVPSFAIGDKLQAPSLRDEDAIVALQDLLAAARHPRILIGRWSGEAIDTILQFAARFDIPLVATPDAKGLVNPHHPLFRGVFGFAGHRGASDLLHDPDTDLILAIGTNMNEWTSSGWSADLLNDKLVHIDESEDHLARTPMARLHVRGRISSVFERLVELALAYVPSPTALPVRKFGVAASPEAVLFDLASYDSDAIPIKPQRLMRELGRRLPPNVRILADAGNSVAWATHYLQPGDRRLGERRWGGGNRKRSRGRRHVTSGWLRLTMDFAPMGWAIGGAIGTAVGNRAVPVVCITGDGSMLMNGQEITVAVAEQLTVIYVVLNDEALGMVKHGQRLAGAECIGFELPPTDFAAMARAMGADAHVVRTPADLLSIDFAAVCARLGPTLIDVHIDGEEVPPMGLRMKVLGTVVDYLPDIDAAPSR